MKPIPKYTYKTFEKKTSISINEKSKKVSYNPT